MHSSADKRREAEKLLESEIRRARTIIYIGSIGTSGAELIIDSAKKHPEKRYVITYDKFFRMYLPRDGFRGKNIFRAIADAEHLPFKNNCSDFTLKVGGVSCAKLEMLFEELHRITAPCGRGLIGDIEKIWQLPSKPSARKELKNLALFAYERGTKIDDGKSHPQFKGQRCLIIPPTKEYLNTYKKITKILSVSTEDVFRSFGLYPVKKLLNSKHKSFLEIQKSYVYIWRNGTPTRSIKSRILITDHLPLVELLMRLR